MPLNCLLVTGCASEPLATTTLPSTAQPPLAAAPDAVIRAAARATPQRFLRWYTPRMDSLNSLCTVPAACSPDTADGYALEFKRVDNYLAKLSKGGFTSARYDASRRAYYYQPADWLRTHPYYDGPAPGIDFDPISYSPEFDDLPVLLRQRPAFLRYTPDSARIRINLFYDGKLEKTLVFRLSRQNTRWLIDDI